MPTFTTWVTAAQAAQLLQPHLPGIDAALLLVDLRRARPGYRARVSARPYWEKRGFRVVYPLAEIERVRDELSTVAHTAPHAPVIAKTVPTISSPGAPT